VGSVRDDALPEIPEQVQAVCRAKRAGRTLFRAADGVRKIIEHLGLLYVLCRTGLTAHEKRSHQGLLDAWWRSTTQADSIWERQGTA